ncbi:NADPH dehydrogenase [Coprinellus micaceus]|uniref:NADPH dehydrogenase n=1 Tax=Coprinellus micaceus TaxID=71717 RepID=A0A4Y7TIT2_COPMI|nr:NADPH dehydrogenase [Coprinellus micaceus]
MSPNNRNIAAKGIPYFTPAQDPPAGSAYATQPAGVPLPILFQPLKIRGVEFHNRIWVSPMCQYSAENGKMTEWHHAHLGGIIKRGPGLTIIEATSVVPEGRITPEDSGIWNDEQAAELAKIVTFAHSQSQKIAIQLAHAGRKASTAAPWITGDATASAEVGGWPDNVWAPSAVSFSEQYPNPKALTREGIQTVVQAFVDGAKRSLKAGFDVIEIHAAHGYLLNSFLSPASNKRTDEYGGNYDNRIRILLEVVDAVRRVIPETMPLFVRVSATEWLEESLPNEPSWKSEDTVRLAPILYEHGVDLLDVSTGGNHSAQKIKGGPAYQAPFARDVMKGIGAKEAIPDNRKAPAQGNGRLPRLLVATVGAITTGPLAEKLLEQGDADAVIVGRQFLRNPFTVWAWADELTAEGKEVSVKLPHQISWGFKGRHKRASDGHEDCKSTPEQCKKLGSCKV